MMLVVECCLLLFFVWVCVYYFVLFSDGECCEVLCCFDIVVWVLLEVCCLVDGLMCVSCLVLDVFEKVLVFSYQCDLVEVYCMMVDIGNEFDFYIFVEELLDIDDLFDSEDDVLIICLINVMFIEVIKEKVLDIYIEIYECYLQICFCVDGVLWEILCLQWWLVVLLILCIKVMVSLDIVEKWVFQDGCMVLCIGG